MKIHETPLQTVETFLNLHPRKGPARIAATDVAFECCPLQRLAQEASHYTADTNCSGHSGASSRGLSTGPQIADHNRRSIASGCSALRSAAVHEDEALYLRG